MTTYRTVSIDGLDIFYREAGSRDNPTILLLHGFPTSSHMFRNLIPALADRFHLVAPDYPGYGNSSMPTVDEFDYTFDHLAEIVEKAVIGSSVGTSDSANESQKPVLLDRRTWSGR